LQGVQEKARSMTVISRLSAYLFADTADFESGMKRAAKSSDDFQQSVSSASNKAALAIAAVAAATTALVIHQTNAIDASLKQAQTLGVSVSQFDAMSRVASEAGVDQQEFTKAITDTQKALFAAATGSVEAQNMFKALGLSYQDLLRLSP